MSTFNDRVSLHDRIQRYVLKQFELRGYDFELYGVESGDLLDFHKVIRRDHTPASALVRHRPDKIVMIPQCNRSFFIDIKTLMRYNTGNYSIELASYDVLLYLSNFMQGNNVIMIFNSVSLLPYGLKACFVSDIEIGRRFDRPWRSTMGSRTAFGLVEKTDSYFLPFDIFFDCLEDNIELDQFHQLNSLPMKIIPEIPSDIKQLMMEYQRMTDGEGVL